MNQSIKTNLMNAIIAQPKKITSAGHICRSHGVMPAKVTAAAQELRISPALVVDERWYFAAQDVDRIAEHLAQQRR